MHRAKAPRDDVDRQTVATPSFCVSNGGAGLVVDLYILESTGDESRFRVSLTLEPVSQRVSLTLEP